MYYLSHAVSVATGVKGFDEDSVASLNMNQEDTQEATVANGSPTLPFQGGGYVLAASYWPKVPCTINTT